MKIPYSKYARMDIDSTKLFDSFNHYRATGDILKVIETHIPVFHRYYVSILENLPWDDTPFEDYCQDYVIKLLRFLDKYKDKFTYYGAYYNFVDQMTRNFCVTIHSKLQKRMHTKVAVDTSFDPLQDIEEAVATYSIYSRTPQFNVERETKYVQEYLRTQLWQQLMEDRPFSFQSKYKTAIDCLLDQLEQQLFFDGFNVRHLPELTNYSESKLKKLKNIILFHYRWILYHKRLGLAAYL